MSKKIEEILSESVGLTEEARASIVEAWESKITEARDVITAELREEFSRRFQHDKGILVESMDRLLTDKIRVELTEFAIDRKELIQEKVAYRQKMKEHAGKMNEFVTKALVKEVHELRADKKKLQENFKKLENFLLKQLSEEIVEFRQDKKALVVQKVKMVSEGKKIIAETRKEFIQRAAKIINESVETSLRSEISQFREDICKSRENDFGRRIFEAVAAEFMTSYLNEGTEIKRLQKIVESKELALKEAQQTQGKAKKLVESLNVKLAASTDLVERSKVMNELLAPLSKDKKSVMKELLESVQTKHLEAAYNKYLPAVLNESMPIRTAKKTLTETKIIEKTGDRVPNALQESDDIKSELKHLKSLAGIK